MKELFLKAEDLYFETDILLTVLKLSLMCRQVELQVQGGRKRTEVAKIGKEPVSQRENAIEDCLNELLEMAKTIGKEQLLLENRFRSSKKYNKKYIPVFIC